MDEVEVRSEPPSRRCFARGTDEFTRVLAFSDAVFAIAMTLLVVGIGIPGLEDTDSVGELADKLNADVGSFVSFFISFAVIGRYWVAHHGFIAQLRAIDRPIIGLNLVYLAFIAFLPFPTGLLGNFFENPLSVAIYAVNVAAVSGMEVVLFRHARRGGLLERELPEDVYRWGIVLSTSPVVFFLASIPVAFASTTVAVLLWFGVLPLQLVTRRFQPEGIDDYF